jgi:uncharacterized RDD family membrane protein YckC
MLYDSLLLVAVWMLAAALVVIPTGDQVNPGHLAFQLYLLVVAWAYFAICWRGGQTLGMKAWRLRLVAPEGKITWSATAIRFLMTLISLLSFGLGFWWSLFHPRRTTWHDLASGTALVVEKRQKK